MTKERDNLTPYMALCDVAEVLGWEGVATVTGLSVSYLRKLSDPDITREISMQNAIRLDAAHLRGGGIGTPFVEAAIAQVQMLSADVDAECPIPILAAVSTAAKEIGEAVAAALQLAGESNNARARRTAIREAEEGLAAMLALLTTLKRGTK